MPLVSISDDQRIVAIQLSEGGIGPRAEYGVKNYRYTVVNDRTVLVDPHSHRILSAELPTIDVRNR
jgi:hypothetical protein